MMQSSYSLTHGSYMYTKLMYLQYLLQLKLKLLWLLYFLLC